MSLILQLLFAVAQEPTPPAAQPQVPVQIPEQVTAQIVLPAEARVPGREIRLGEVADVRGADADLTAQLEAYPLGYSPSPGYSRLLFHYRIEEQLERAFRNLDVRMAGERSVRVWPQTEAVQPERLKATVSEALTIALRGRDVELNFIGLPPELEVPAGTATPRLQPRISDASLRPGVVEVPVDVFVGEARFRTLHAQVELIEWAVVPVLRRDMPAGATLSSADFEVTRVRAVDSPEQPLTLTMAHGSIASRALRAGQSVTELDVHRPLAVHSGQQLSIEVRRGAVRARAMGEAIDSGSIGERIRVKLLESGREMRGVIEARDNVVVDLGGGR